MESQSSGGGTNILKRINIRPNATVICRDDEETHAIGVVARNIMTKLQFKVVDACGNGIDVDGKHLSFSMVIMG